MVVRIDDSEQEWGDKGDEWVVEEVVIRTSAGIATFVASLWVTRVLYKIFSFFFLHERRQKFLLFEEPFYVFFKRYSKKYIYVSKVNRYFLKRENIFSL